MFWQVLCQNKLLRGYLARHFKVSVVPECILRSPSSAIRLSYIAGVSDATPGERRNLIATSSTTAWLSTLQVLCYSCGFETQISMAWDRGEATPQLTLTTKSRKDAEQLLACSTLCKRQAFATHESKCAPVTDESVSACYNGVDVTDIFMDADDIHDTYDITVANAHEFFCNGFLTHNSACICIGDHDDVEYLRAKRWDLGNIPNWRAMSNNSVACDDVAQLPEEFWEGYKGNGEPYGLINLNLARRIGRSKDGAKYPDPSVEGFNPCAEQGLANHETCCLSEIFLPNLTSFGEAVDVATMAYRICKHSLLLPCHHPETHAIVQKNLRMGIGITGYMQATEEQRGWLSPLYEKLRIYDVEYSAKLGVATSVKLTTCKPS